MRHLRKTSNTNNKNAGFIGLAREKTRTITGYAASITPTIDDMSTRSQTFTPTGHYELTTTPGSNTHFIVINGTKYYYTPSEGTVEKNSILAYLAGTTLTTTGASSSNYVFKQGSTYYTFDTSKLPSSVYSLSEVSSTDPYNFVADGKYYHIDFPGRTNLYTTVSDAEPATVTGKTKGSLTVKLPNNENRTVWYQYDTDKKTSDRINDSIASDGSNVQGKVFAGISGSLDGSAIYNSQDKSTVDIAADFIGNSISRTINVYGGAISNDQGKIGSITGDFIGNSSLTDSSHGSFGGAISNYYGSINSISGNFIGNFSSGGNALGGAISNYYGTIGSLTADFIGNSASSQGGAIYNNGTIGSITGDFIGNSASIGGAIYNGSISSDNPSYNANSRITLTGNTFTGNYIDNNGTVTPNSIYNAGIINIANGAAVTINDGYNGLGEAQLNIGTDSIFNLSVDNGVVQKDNLGTVINNGTINWDLDIDLAGTLSDKITAANLDGNQSIIIRVINLTTGTGDEQFDITLTDNEALKNAYTLSSDILSHITKATGVTYTVNTVDYDRTKGILTFNKTPFVAGDATIDKIYTDSNEYLELDSANHAQYSDLVTTKDANHPDIVVLDGKIYYFKTNESSDTLNEKVRNLAATGAKAFKEVTSNDNWIFSAGGKYYTYTANALPKSVYTVTAYDTEPASWNWTNGTKYYKMNFSGDKNRSNAYTVLSDTEFTDAAGKTKGSIQVKLPNNETRTVWYQYNTEDQVSTRVGNMTGDITGKVYKGISYSDKGGVIYNDEAAGYSIVADFIGISVSSSYDRACGGAIYNGGTIASITGDFIGGSVSSSLYGASGGAIYNNGTIGSIAGDFIGSIVSGVSDDYGGAIYNSGTIASISGDFIANSASSPSNSNAYGGAIYNNDTIGSITGDFVGNTASTPSLYKAYGGAIYNWNSTIGSIVGDFIANSTSSPSQSRGGAIYNLNSTIGSIAGDFIGNSAPSDYNASGGAIDNYGTISSITGDFIANSASASHSTSSGHSIASGGAINNLKTIGSIAGNFRGSSASSQNEAYGGAIYNDGGTIGAIMGDFTDNYAKSASAAANAYGGAIYNGSISSSSPTYNANSRITLAGNTFTGNYVDNNGAITPNSIYNAGIINIKDGATVTVNDGYDGLGEAQLNIGTDSIFNLSVDNGVIQTDNLGTVTNNGTINWDLDVDLTGNSSDNIIANSITGTNSIVIRTINLMTDKEGQTDVAFASGSPIASYILSDSINIISHGEFVYTVAYNNSTGILTFNKVPNSLASKLHAGFPKVREYDMTILEAVGENLGSLAGGSGAKLTVNGGNFAINGGTFTGITVADGQTLVFNNISDVTGFANDTAVTNGGALELSNSKFSSKILGDGATTVKAGTVTLNNTLTQKDLTVESGAGLNIAANNLNITNTVKNDGTVTLSGGATDNYATLSSSIGNKTAESTSGKTVIDGYVNVASGKSINQAIEINSGKALTANVNSVGGDITNNGDLAIYGYEDQTDTTFNQAVTGNGSTTITRKVNVDGNIANNIIIDKFDGTTPAVTHYADITAGDNGTLGAAGKTITITGDHDGDIYNKLTVNADKIAADTVKNDGKLVLTGGEFGADITKNTSAGIVDITAGTDGTVTISKNVTDQTINVNSGTLHLNLGSDYSTKTANTTVNVANSTILNTIDNVINDYTSTVLLADGAIVKADIDAAAIDKYGAATGATSVTLGAMNAFDIANIQNREFQLVNGSVRVNADNLAIINTTGKSVSVVGSGLADGMVKVSESTSADKLNGAVYISPTKSSITYIMAANEAVNTDRPALGYIHDNFIINSDATGTQRTITATENTKGLIVDSGKSLTLQDVKFEKFATGEVNATTHPSADRAYDGDYQGIITNYGTLDITNSYFTVEPSDGNTKKIAIANYGTLTSDPTTYEGAVENYRGATATITGDTFQNIDRSSITSANGGAIYNEAAEGSSPAGTLTLNKVIATDNKAINGGVLYNAGNATINGGSYSGNSATALGGAIYSNTNLTVNANATNGAVSFSNNKHQTATTEALNDIYMAGAAGTPIVLNLNAADTTTNTITLGSGVAGTNYNVNINDGTTGLVSVAGVKDAVTIALKGGELDLTTDSNATNLNAANATILNASSINGLTVDTLTIADSGTFTNKGNLNVTSTLNNGSTGVTGTITNTNGTLNLLGGTSATSPMTNIGTISGGNINIGSYTSDTEKDIAYVVNSGSISGEVSIAKESTLQTAANTVTDTTGIANAGILELTGGNLVSSVTGDGTTNIVEDVTNTLGKTISQKLINVNEGVSLTSAADKVIATDRIFNKGSLILTGGTLTSTVKGADGQTYIENGNVIANSTIYQIINIEAGKGGTLTASADNVRGRVINDVENGLVLTGGTTYLSPGKILGSGSTKIDAGTDGTVINQNSIEQNINIASGTLQNYKEYEGYIIVNGYIKGDITIGTEGTLKSALHSDFIYYNNLITNNGKIYIEDDYLRNIAGASGTTYLDQNVITRGRDCTIAGTLDAQNHTVNMVDYAYNTLSVGDVKNAKLEINIDPANNQFDSIQVTGATSTGTVNLTNVNILNYSSAIGKNPYSITSQIINNTNGGDISLDLTGLADKTLTTSATYTYDTNVTKDMKWSDVIGEYTVTDATVNAAFGLDTTSVTNDSLTVTLTTAGGNETLTTQRDTLAALIAATGTGFENKTFTADSDATYVVGQNEAIDGLGTLAGSLTIDGGTEYAKIDGNSKLGITVNSGSTLTVKDADLDNFSGTAITNSGKLNLENMIFGSEDIGLAIVNKEGGILKSNDSGYLLRVENAGTSLFVGDEFLSNRGGINGGAIYNTGSLILTETDFFFNKAEGLGGAIYSTKDVTINAENVALEFTGNVDSSGANDIYMAGTAQSPITLALNSKTTDHIILINDGINGTYYNTVINGAEDNEGEILVHGNINTNALTVSAGILVNNGDLTVKSGTNNGTIRGAGNFILNDSGAASPLVFNNNNRLTQRSLTITSGKFVTDTNNLYLISENDIDDDDFEIVDDIINDGTLTFNNTANNGIIVKNIKGSTTLSHGIIEIAVQDGVAISLNGKSITDNDVKLTSGIFDVTSNADDDGNINISSMGLISGNGILNVQDGETGNITLGTVATGTGDYTKNLNVAIDTNFATNTTETDSGITGHADVISVASLTGDGKIHISDIRMTADPIATEMTAQVATGDTAIENLDFTNTTISNMSDSVGSLLLSYDNDTNSATKGYLTAVHSDLTNAITSSITTKMYSMGGSEPAIDNLTLGGTSLSITTNGHDIVSTSSSADGIKIANSGQTLSITGTLDSSSGNPETTISGFKTAIDNSKGGTVNLTNIELNENTTDIQNEGTLNLNGRNTVNTIADNTTPTGTTNVKSGTSIIDTITQKIVEIFTGAKLETETVTASEQVKNAGDLTITGASNSSKITGNGTTEFTNNVNNSGDISQGTVKVADGKTLTTTGDITTDNLTNGGTVTLNSADTTLTIKGGTSDTPTTVGGTINGTGSTKIEGNAQNNGTIASAVEIAASGKLSTNANDVTGVITNNATGGLTLTGGTIQNTIEGTGSTVISGTVLNNKDAVGKSIDNAVTITSTGNLTTAADKLGGAVENNGTTNGLTLTGGKLSQNVTGTGKTIIDGTDVSVKYGNSIAQNIEITSGNKLINTNVTAIGGDVENNGDIQLYSWDNDKLEHNITGTGTTELNQKVVVAADIENAINIKSYTDSESVVHNANVTVESGHKFGITGKDITVDLNNNLIMQDADDIKGNLINNGVVELQGGLISSTITGTGTTNISGNVGTNGNNITQTNVIIGYNGTDETNGLLINDTVINATNINVTELGFLGNIGTISAAAIANAGNVYIENGNVNVGNLITVTNGTTNVYGGNVNADSIINNGETNISYGVVVADIIENTGAGTTTISGGDVTANTSIINSGTGSTDINSVVKTPLVSASDGTVNINATGGQTATSNLLKDKAGTGAANITTLAGSTVAVNTNSNTMAIDNNVSGAGTLKLNGSTGSEFYVSPNVIVASAVNIAAGQLNADDGLNITGPISVAANATLSTMNGNYTTFNNITFANGANLKVDVNAVSNKSDKFATPIEPTGGYEYLTDLNIQNINKISQNGKSINLSNAIGLNNLQSSDSLTANLADKYSSVLTPIRKMSANVQMTPEGLMLNIAGTGNKYKDFNPAVMASPVAAQMGGYLTQLNSYDEAFRNMDMYMLMTAQQRQALKYKNKIASLDGGVLYDKTLMRQERAEGWFRPYATFEKVGLKNGPKVENQAYGTFVGGESQMYDLGHGWDGMWGAYVGYNGSHQNYDGVSIYQNGGTLGLTGMAYKGNFFTGLTLNAGASAAEAHTMYGHEDITMLMAGIASKTGYNWELANGKFIIQPSMLMSYSFVNTFDYTNAAGVRMHSSPLNAIQLQPELKFIGNLKNGWQPYASVAMVWNIMDDTKFKANDVTLPELSVKPYVKYGVGLRKIWGERFTGFFQTYLTNSGRNGVGLQAGFTWALGGGKDKKADEQKIQKSLKRAPELKKSEIVLNGKKVQ